MFVEDFHNYDNKSSKGSAGNNQILDKHNKDGDGDYDYYVSSSSQSNDDSYNDYNNNHINYSDNNSNNAGSSVHHTVRILCFSSIS
jgi:hypothetical protein